MLMGWIHDQIHGSELFCLYDLCVGNTCTCHVVAEGEALLLCSFQLLLGLFFSRKARISWHAIGVFAAT